MGKKPTTAATYDIDTIRSAAKGRWPEILSSLGNFDRSILDGKHHPCPRCAGTDRFRFIDSDAGACFCNACFAEKNGDGFAAVQWLLSCKFGPAVERIAGHLGIEKISTSTTGTTKKTKSAAPGYATIAEAITGMRDWLRRKHQGLVVNQRALGWAYPLADGTVNFWAVRYNTSDGKRFCPFFQSTADQLWRSGDPPGLLPLFNLPALAAAEHVHLHEGEKAAEAFAELGLTSTTSAHGCKSAAKSDWSPLAGKRVTLYPDNDPAGEAYIAEVAGHLAALSPPAIVDVKRLPGLPDKGDYFDLAEAMRKAGKTDNDIRQVIAAAPAESARKSSLVVEANDDPHRLARINLERYAATTDGATIKYWREEFWTWKASRGCYRKIGIEEFRAKIAASVKAEFDRLNLEAQEMARATGEKPPKAQKVQTGLITNVLNATKSLTLVPSSTELMSWIGDQAKRRSGRNYIAVTNGILDIDRLMRNEPGDGLSDVLLPLSPDWFASVRLPYAFDPTARCPRWEAYLEKCLEMDPERIKILQEWAGYLLTVTGGHQKALVLEGEGGNGKSVYYAGITAIIGEENRSTVSIEGLSDKFLRSATLGKLANICADVDGIDKVNLGELKSFISGDPMHCDRKFLSGVDARSTARLMFAWNNRPRFSDHSDGMMRRLIMIPFRVKIAKTDRVRLMDTHEWWQRSGELPGMLNWAITGLARLQAQGDFTESELSNLALEDYKCQNNPARAFLLESLEFDGKSKLQTSEIYRLYKLWASTNNYRTMSSNSFGTEIGRAFPKAERKQYGPRGSQKWCYVGIRFALDEICGEHTSQAMLF